MTKRPASWLLLAATLTLAACAGHGEAPRPAVTAPALAPLSLDLAALWAPRRLFAALGLPRKARITVTGPDRATLFDVTQDLATTGTLVALGGVPAGERMLIAVTGLDAASQPVPGQVHRAIGRIGPGPTTVTLTAMSNAAGLVVEALGAIDQRVGTTVAAQLDYAALDRAIPRYARELRAPTPGLLDVAAIAADIHAASGAVPITRPGFLLAAGRLVLSPTAWPPGATATVTLDDPASTATPVEGKPAVLGPVAPGTWTLTLVPDQAGLAPVTSQVTVAPGAEVRTAIGFGAPEALTRLSAPLGAAAAGVVTLEDGSQRLALAGGATLAAAGPEPIGVIRASTALRWPPSAQVPPLPLAASVSAPAAAVADGRLFWFGGLGDGGASAAGWVYAAVGGGQVTARAGLPGGTGLLGASAVAIGDRIYVTGGTRADGTPSAATMAYDFAADAWAVAGDPAIAPHRSCMASAAVGDTWYLFGGFGGAGLAAPQPAGVRQPVARVSAWKPAFDDGFRDLAPLPTPRAAATAVVANGRVWVIGGVTRGGALTGAVEVYDPATDAWSLRPPLQRPRAYAGAGLVNGQVVVLGGLLGDAPGTDLPVDDVEAFTP